MILNSGSWTRHFLCRIGVFINRISGSDPHSLIYLLTAIGLSPGGRSTVHIYTQTIHRTIQNKQYIEQHNNFEQHNYFDDVNPNFTIKKAK